MMNPVKNVLLLVSILGLMHAGMGYECIEPGTSCGSAGSEECCQPDSADLGTLCVIPCNRIGGPDGRKQYNGTTCVVVPIKFYNRYVDKDKGPGHFVFQIGYECYHWFNCPEGDCHTGAHYNETGDKSSLKTCRNSQSLKEGQTGCNYKALCENGLMCINDECVKEGCTFKYHRCHVGHKCCDAGSRCAFQIQAGSPPSVPHKRWEAPGYYCVPKKPMKAMDL